MQYPLRKLVIGSKNLSGESKVEPSDRLFTPANGMTALRPFLGGLTLWLLARDKKTHLPWATMAMAATGGSDAEGSVARLVDRFKPSSGLGTSKRGAEGDPIADTIALIEMGIGAMVSPKMRKVAKFAVGVTLAQEATKAAWAANATRRWRNATISEEHPKGLRLKMPVEEDGRLAMLEKIIGGGAAVASSEAGNPILKVSLEATALALSVTGAVRGEITRRGYEAQLSQDIAQLAMQETV